MRSLSRIGIARLGAVLAGLTLMAPLAAPAAQVRPGSPDLLRLAPALEGWTLSEAPRSFFPESLFEYIDGAAESYLGYDFRELLVADYEKKGTAATLTVEIYDMGGPLNAFGIFAAERYPENKAVPLGELAYVEGEALNLLAGRFYVKMMAYGLGDGTEKALQDAGTKVTAAIKPAGGLPGLVLAFPKEGLIARSEKYVKRNFMGYEFLHDGFVAGYASGGREIEGFIIDGGSEAEAETMLSKLLAAAAADGQTVEKRGLGVHVRNRYGQHLFITRAGTVLCGAMRVPDGLEAAGEALLKALAAGLERTPAK